jgi:hypothetical protein
VEDMEEASIEALEEEEIEYNVHDELVSVMMSHFGKYQVF